jgi:hypothetical protein
MHEQEAILRARFAHRRNANGTFDSICCQCYATVSRQSNPSKHAQLETEHVCSPSDLRRFEVRVGAWSTWSQPQQKREAKPTRKKGFGSKATPKADPHASYQGLAGLMAG